MMNGRIGRLLVAFAVSGAALALAPAASAQSKLGVVDTQRAIMETEDGLRAQATLKKMFDSRQRELDKKQDDLQKEREDIEKQKDVLSKGALAKRVEKWQREMVQLQTVFVEYNKELQKKQNELTQPVFQKAMGIIRRLATQEGYDLIVDKQAVPYVRSDLDLTDKIITLYNSGAGGTAAEKGKPGDKPGAASRAPTPAVPALRQPPALSPVPAAPAPKP
ncbi:MAG TPA: OmpH family outer membrane protein [Polyangiaceae bacterium]|nr:OmpH family outer membrane protein [Polyangiaceae bacterium]